MTTSLRWVSALVTLASALTGCAGDQADSTSSSDALSGSVTAFTPTRPSVTGGQLSTYRFIASYSASDVDAGLAADGFFEAKLAPRARCGVSLYEASYKTTSPNGEALVNATAAAMTPLGPDAACNGPRPLLVVAPGTHLEPSEHVANAEDALTRLIAGVFVAQGFTVVIPDLLGNGVPGTFPDYPKLSFNPYLHAQSEATAVLDSIRAARSALPLTGAMVLLGPSQGAHAALAAERLARAVFPGEFDIRAAAYDIGVVDVPETVTTWRRTESPLYRKTLDAWSQLYSPGRTLTWPDEVLAKARSNDLVEAETTPSTIPISICGYANDNVVPFGGSRRLAAKLGAEATLIELGDEEVQAATPHLVRFNTPGIAAHTVSGAICATRHLDAFLHAVE